MADGRTRRAFLSLVGVGTTAGCSRFSLGDETGEQVSGDPATDWFQIAHDSGHTAYVPTADGVPPKIRWELGPYVRFSEPIVVGKSVYVMAEVTKKDLFGNPKRGTKSVLFRIDEADGSVERVAEAGNDGNDWDAKDLIFYRGRFYLATHSELFALNARTGNTEWRRETGTTDFTPVADGGRIFAGCSDAVCGYDATSGERLWRTSASPDKPILYSPAVANGRVVYVENDGNSREPPQSATVKAVRADTGEELWSREDDVVNYGMAALSDGTVYLGNRKYVYALDAETGKRQWRTSIDRPEYMLGPELCVGPEYVYVPENPDYHGRLAALSREDGKREWSIDTKGYIGYRPVRTEKNLYLCVSGEQNRVVAEDYHASVLSLNPATGDHYWRYRLFSYAPNEPIASSDSLYATYGYSGEMSLVAFGY
jgi:outer membrane protein assembly factor BamB